MIKCERMWKLTAGGWLKRPSFKGNVTTHRSNRVLRRRCNGAKIIYRIWDLPFFTKIITGSGTFCKPVGIPVRDPGGIRSANADISNDKRSGFFRRKSKGFCARLIRAELVGT